jgi:16S rRNA (guanine966-N2)-methyltransferase
MPPKKAQKTTLPHAIHLIGGRWRRRRIDIPSHTVVRPTPSRVRQTLFDWLGTHLQGKTCIDACAGTGALGLEAASRGARSVLFIEQDPVLSRRLHHLCQTLVSPPEQTPEKNKASFTSSLPLPLPLLRVITGRALEQMQRLTAASVEGVFLDPPFQDKALLLALLQQAMRVVIPGGWIYVETDMSPFQIGGWPTPEQGLHLYRHAQFGQVCFGVWQVRSAKWQV